MPIRSLYYGYVVAITSTRKLRCHHPNVILIRTLPFFHKLVGNLNSEMNTIHMFVDIGDDPVGAPADHKLRLEPQFLTDKHALEPVSKRKLVLRQYCRVQLITVTLSIFTADWMGRMR